MAIPRFTNFKDFLKAENYTALLDEGISKGNFGMRIFSKGTKSLANARWLRGGSAGPTYGAAMVFAGSTLYGGYRGYKNEGTLAGVAKGALIGGAVGRAGIGAYRAGLGMWNSRNKWFNNKPAGLLG